MPESDESDPADRATDAPPPLQHAYGSSAPLTLGVEEEFMLVHPETFGLVPAFDDVAAIVRERGGTVGCETTQSVLEGITDVCADMAEAEEAVVAHRTMLASAARQAGCRLAAAGTHPYCWTELEKVSPQQHYQDLMRDFPWIARESVTYGMHVHVGIPTAEDAIRVTNALRPLLPVFVALAANSPFWKGEDTGLRSTRMPLAGLYPRSGLTPRFRDWAEYEATISALGAADAKGANPAGVWWLVRPQPRLGTIEVRVFDTQTEASEALALTALLQATCAVLLEDERAFHDVLADSPDVVIEQNLFAATKDGIDAEFVDVGQGRHVSAREATRGMLSVVAGALHELGSQHYVDTVERLLRCNGAERQRLQHVTPGVFQPVMRELVERTEPRSEPPRFRPGGNVRRTGASARAHHAHA